MEDSKLTRRAIVQMALIVILVPMLPLLISWQWDWWEAWVYAFLSIGGFVVSRVLAGRKNPGQLAERAKGLMHQDAEEWDRKLAPIAGLGGSVIPIAAGLDAVFGWSASISLPVRLVGLALMLIGYFISTYALVENSFFSGMVRLQKERGHHVIDTGPYAWVRHPGYAGALLLYIGVPLLLNSWWSYLPFALWMIPLVIRTSKEDQFLQEKLEGYKEFTRKTKYRLFPGIW